MDSNIEKIVFEPHKHLAGDLRHGPFIVFDIETTGGNPSKNGITEVSALRYENGEVKDRFYTMVNPLIPIPPIVRKITGISNRTVKNAPTIEQVMPSIVEFIGDNILVSHNTIGDLKFLVHYARKVCDVEMENFFLCTHLLTEKLIPHAPDKSLKGLEAFLELNNEGRAHRAEADALVTLQLFQFLVARLIEDQKINNVGDAVRFQGDFFSSQRLGPIFPLEKLDNLNDSPGVVTLFNRLKEPVFAGSVFNLRREAQGLLRIDALPKRFAKLVLSSYDVETQTCPSLFSAMVAEAEALTQHGLSFQTYQWHQRFVSGIFFEEDGDKVCVGIGWAPPGSRYVFGPVHDKRVIQDLLDKLGAVLGCRKTQHGIILSPEQASVVVALFDRSLGPLLRGSMWNVLKPTVWFSAQRRKRHFQQISKSLKLVGFEVPTNLKNLLLECGAIVERQRGRGWVIYPVANTRLLPCIQVQGDLAEWAKSDACKQLMQTIRDAAETSKNQGLTADDTHHAQVVLWLLHTARQRSTRNCFFQALDELPNLQP